MPSINKKSIDADHLKALVGFAKSVNLTEFVWEEGDQRVSFKRQPHSPLPSKKKASSLKTQEPRTSSPAPKTHKLLSPMVGTFLRALKNRPPMVVEGENVKPGQKLAVVEALKVPKDVICDVSGRIIKILVDGGKSVEYAQELFEIEIH